MNPPAVTMLAGAELLAFDRGTVRTKDADGRMHVSLTNISREQVAEYLGSEVPMGDQLGLDPKALYKIYRPGVELAKAVERFNKIPVLADHAPVSAADHKPDLVVGATADAVYEAPFLKAGLVVWAADAIERIETGEQKELSCAYRYTPVLENGTFDGVAYSIRMTDIVPNHVALVAKGRAGPDVLVADSQITVLPITPVTPLIPTLEPLRMKLSPKAIAVKGALKAYLAPKLAQDAKLGDLNPLFAGIDAKTIKAKTSDLVKAVEAKVKGKLVQDADLSDLKALLAAFCSDDPDEADEVLDADPVDELLAMLSGKLSDEEMAAFSAKLRALIPAAAAADGDFPPKTPETPDPPEKKEAMDDAVSKPAMDAAIKLAVDGTAKKVKQETIEQMRAISEAEKVVRPWVGEVVAQDSAESVYKAALEILEIKVEGVHPSAYRAILEAQPKPGDRTLRIVADAAPAADFSKRFAGLDRLRSV